MQGSGIFYSTHCGSLPLLSTLRQLNTLVSSHFTSFVAMVAVRK